jgi:hypothetical protein
MLRIGLFIGLFIYLIQEISLFLAYLYAVCFQEERRKLSKKYHKRWVALTTEKKIEFIRQALAAEEQHKVCETHLFHLFFIFFCEFRYLSPVEIQNCIRLSADDKS